MGKLNEIQQETKQSFGSNSFTTKIEDNRVVFDSEKDSFRFNDPVDVQAITVNGEPISGGGSEVEVVDLVEPSERLVEIANVKIDGADNKIYVPKSANGSLMLKSTNYPTTRYALLSGGGASEPGLTLSKDGNYSQYLRSGINVNGRNITFPEITEDETFAVKSDIPFGETYVSKITDETISFGSGSYGVEGTISNFEGTISQTGNYTICLKGIKYECRVEDIGMDAIIYGNYDGRDEFICVYKVDNQYYIETDLLDANEYKVQIFEGYAVKGIEGKYIPQLDFGKVIFKVENGDLKVSLNGGASWKVITLTDEE